jgi:hypothetical protein
MERFTRRTLFSASLSAAVLAETARTTDLTGTWVLDVEKSSWGKMKVPASVIVHIRQDGNDFSYTGWVAYRNEETREFAFRGAVDGKEYPVSRSYGPGKLAFRRTDHLTLESDYKSNDGKYSESVRTVVIVNGRMMTRYMSLRSPVGARTWIEVYRRQR